MTGTQDTVGFTKRCSEFFGIRTIGELKKELGALTERDKLDLVAMFNAAGMPTLLPQSKVTN